MSLPLVSYIIISMNRSAELAECLANVRLQEYPHKEIIVVDNGSTDDTGNIVRNCPFISATGHSKVFFKIYVSDLREAVSDYVSCIVR